MCLLLPLLVLKVGMETLEDLTLVGSHLLDSILRTTMMKLTMTSALGEGKTKKLSALGMGDLRVLEISPSLEVEGKTKEKKVKGMKKESLFLLEVDLRGRRTEVEEVSLCSKNQA